MPPWENTLAFGSSHIIEKLSCTQIYLPRVRQNLQHVPPRATCTHCRQPPEMRLAQFARSSAGGGGASGDTNLYGLPEMEVSRSMSNVYESNSGGVDVGWPAVTSKGSAALNAVAMSSAAAVAAVAAAAAGGGGGGEGTTDSSPEDSLSPTMGPTLTPARYRHSSNRGPEGELLSVPGSNNASPQPHGYFGVPASGVDAFDGFGQQVSGRALIRSSMTSARSMASASSPVPGMEGGEFLSVVGGVVAGGMGAEAAAQAFAEVAELEALQIDKNDLKLVFGRPFARGKSSEVYQVTHSGKNRAAKVMAGAGKGGGGDGRGVQQYVCMYVCMTPPYVCMVRAETVHFNFYASIVLSIARFCSPK